ncbi:MAG: BON domain-containing protein [Roseiarcus sp.]
MDDKALRQRVVDELEFEPSVEAAHIGVAAEQGVITLSGHVGSYAEKIAAELATRRVKGVVGIAEEIEVRYPGSNPVADDEIAERCLNVLAWDVFLAKDAVRVKVERGWVELDGKVKWQFQREAAENSVRKLGGVVGVSNRIEVQAEAQGAEIKSRIESALKRNALVDANEIRIVVDGDEVTLEGKVHTWNERADAERAAWSAPGVSFVVNHLRIA